MVVEIREYVFRGAKLQRIFGFITIVKEKCKKILVFLTIQGGPDTAR